MDRPEWCFPAAAESSNACRRFLSFRWRTVVGEEQLRFGFGRVGRRAYETARDGSMLAIVSSDSGSDRMTYDKAAALPIDAQLVLWNHSYSRATP